MRTTSIRKGEGMNQTFGQRLVIIRRSKTLNDKKMSQEDAARLVGCSLATYRAWEKDRALPSAIFRKYLAEIWNEVFG